MSASPQGVLRSIAHRLGCRLDEIEDVVDREMGGVALERSPDPERRLDLIRRKLQTPEGEDVVDQAARVGSSMFSKGKK